MRNSFLGVAGKVNATIGLVVLTGTIVFAVLYSYLETEKRNSLERKHLEHLAAAVSGTLENARDAGELQLALDRTAGRLEKITGIEHQLTVLNKEGVSLASSRSFSKISSDVSRLVKLTIPISLKVYSEHGREVTAKLYITKGAMHLDEIFWESLLRHLLFAFLLTGFVLFSASILIRRIIIDPVRELVSATNDFAQDGSWDPIRPVVRRNDEIGTLADRLAEMSRRLRDAVREERSGLADIVVLRIHRDLDEPIQRLAIHVSSLRALLQADSEADQVRLQIESDVNEIRDQVRALEELGSLGRKN